ncbi:MAG: phosphatase [Atopobiaceae bacterium]|nr:phosphatase [Atopobiaceae bacterium]
MTRVAVIDVGTVTARLAISSVEAERVTSMTRRSTIVNLGEGVDHSGILLESACNRLLSCIDDYLAEVRGDSVDALCCTLTSAARDAKNSAQLLDELAARGLKAQVIPGEVEGRLTFLGVAQDFPTSRLLVADNGGGSTEFAVGSLEAGRTLSLDFVRSIDVGCRRVTEKFLSRADPPTSEDLAAAHEFAAEAFEPVLSWERTGVAKPNRLVVTGGTSTTIVALAKALVPYDSSQVHLATISREVVDEQERRLAGVTAAERAKFDGIQPKRAPVILGGVVAVSEILRAAGFGELTVSESDLLYGLSLTVAAAVEGRPSPVGWAPEL